MYELSSNMPRGNVLCAAGLVYFNFYLALLFDMVKIYCNRSTDLPESGAGFTFESISEPTGCVILCHDEAE